MRLFACEAKNESSRNTGAYARGNKKQRNETKRHRKGDRRVRADGVEVYESGHLSRSRHFCETLCSAGRFVRPHSGNKGILTADYQRRGRCINLCRPTDTGVVRDESPSSPRERDEKKSPYTRRTLIRSGSRNRRRPGECRGQNERTPAMRHLFAKRAHCKWHNIAPPKRRRIGSTCARVPKVSSRNRGCPFRGYGCGGNPQEGGSIFIIQEEGAQHSPVREMKHGRKPSRVKINPPPFNGGGFVVECESRGGAHIDVREHPRQWR